MEIPTVDLSDFLRDEGESSTEGKKKAIETIKEACADYGFFQIVNHGVPLDLMIQAVHLSKIFFAFSDDEKLKYSPGSGAPLPAGYNKQPENSPDKNEYLLMFQPQSGFNKLPTTPHGFREVDFMAALRYFPANETENNGITEHEDGNLVAFVIQDEVGGLEVKKDGKWIPVVPAQATIVVNLGDVIHVLSNNKFKSATYRVVRYKEKNRHSFAFFFTVEGDKWVEPLPQFTEEIAEKPKYKGFLYKDYQVMRMRNKTHPPSRPEDAITIKHYAIE
ncbi:hypothetical protein ACP275_09G039400 [Erythranthe tilingii]